MEQYKQNPTQLLPTPGGLLVENLYVFKLRIEAIYSNWCILNILLYIFFNGRSSFSLFIILYGSNDVFSDFHYS